MNVNLNVKIERPMDRSIECSLERSVELPIVRSSERSIERVCRRAAVFKHLIDAAKQKAASIKCQGRRTYIRTLFLSI